MLEKSDFVACVGHAAPAWGHEATERVIASLTFPAKAEYVGYMLNMVNAENIAFVECITKGLGI